MSKEKLFTAIAVSAAFLQTITSVSLLGFPVANGIVTTVMLTVVAVYTIKKQRVSIEVNDTKAHSYTWILIIIAIGGGMNDLLGIVHFNPMIDVILKTIVSGSIGLLNVISKSLFPTMEGQILDRRENQLKVSGEKNEKLRKLIAKES